MNNALRGMHCLSSYFVIVTLYIYNSLSWSPFTAFELDIIIYHLSTTLWELSDITMIYCQAPAQMTIDKMMIRARMIPGWPQDDHRMTTGWPQDDHRMTTGWPQDGPTGWPQDDLIMTQEDPRWPPGWLQDDLRWPQDILEFSLEF